MEREKKREKKKKICSKLTKSLERDVALVSLLLTLNTFHTFFSISIVRCVFSLIISLPALLLLITSNQSILNMAQNINNGFGRKVKIPLFFKIG